MHSSTAALVLAFSALTMALPSPTQLAPRCGTTLYPSLITYVDSSVPDTSVGDVSFISASSAPSGPFRIAEVRFDVPAGAVGSCQLNYQFASNAAITATGPNAQLQVYTAAGTVQGTDTFHNHPAIGNQYGVINALQGGAATVNSQGCASSLSYFVQTFEQWEENSGSAPSKTIEFDQIDGTTGLFLTYGC
ncbi:MAG: hypothetical protein M1824_005042 [Vezdaea acicularis]|nr:MAG: hypothetical protein M1824_005042 [Vezdaea acicularis]